jgi:hypothetical protein
MPKLPSFVNKHELSVEHNVAVDPCRMRVPHHPNWRHVVVGMLFFFALSFVLSRIALAVYSLVFYLITPSARYVPVDDQEKVPLPEKS